MKYKLENIERLNKTEKINFHISRIITFSN
jgi:hypothetical protein